MIGFIVYILFIIYILCVFNKITKMQCYKGGIFMEKPDVLKPYYRLLNNGKPVRVAREGYMGCYVYLNETDIIPTLKMWYELTEM